MAATRPAWTDRGSTSRMSALPVGLACPENAPTNCAKVTASSYSKVAGLPVALLGTIFFVGMAVLCMPQAWRQRRLDAVRTLGAAAGVVWSLWFVWVELFRLDAICLWCTVVHISTLALLGAVLWTTTGLLGAPTR
jgi:uncharacterized membrane protein